MRAVVTASFSGVVLHFDGPLVHAARGSEVFVSEDQGLSWRWMLALPLSSRERLTGCSRLSRRLFRAGIHRVALAGSRLVLFANREIYSYDSRTLQSHDPPTPIVGSRPLVVCSAGDALYYGEYRANEERAPVSVFASHDYGVSWQVATTLQGVRHIHGVFHDPFEDSLWVTTGDRDWECGLWRTRDRFRTLERVIGGYQHARAIQLLFTEKHIYYGSDSPDRINQLFRFSRRSGSLEPLQRVQGSVFYGSSVGDHLFFSTACEPSKTDRAREATIWYSIGGKSWHQLLRFKKDPWPMRVFQYGQVLFPTGCGDGRHLWCTPFATEGDQRSLCLALD